MICLVAFVYSCASQVQGPGWTCGFIKKWSVLAEVAAPCPALPCLPCLRCADVTGGVICQAFSCPKNGTGDLVTQSCSGYCVPIVRNVTKAQFSDSGNQIVLTLAGFVQVGGREGQGRAGLPASSCWWLIESLAVMVSGSTIIFRA